MNTALASVSDGAMVEVRSLHKRYGAVTALNGVSFEVHAGEIYGLLGPNGAGKSTTINILCGLVAPDGGSAYIEGNDVVRHATDARRALGVVPQEPALYTELSARENLSFFGRLYGLHGGQLRQRIDEALAAVDLQQHNGRAGNFSGGMLRRLSIAAGLLHHPRVLLLDEPTIGLDPQNRRSILELVQKIAADGAAVIYTSHYLEEVEQICHRIGIIDQGKLLTEGTLPELQKAAGNLEAVVLSGNFRIPLPAKTFAHLPGASVTQANESELSLQVPDAESHLPALLQAAASVGEVRAASIRRASLETLFVQLTGRELRG